MTSRILPAVVFLLASAVPASSAEKAAKKEAAKPVVAEASWDARVTRVSGMVKVRMAGAAEGGEIDAKADMPLSPGDRVLTGRDGKAEIAFEGESAIELGSNSNLEIEDVAKNGTSLRMKAGYLVAKIKFMLNRRFRVRTPTSVSAVRGTEFAVEIADESSGKTVVGVFGEGKIAVSQGEEESAGERLVTPNEELECAMAEPIGPVRKLDFLKKREEQAKQFRARIAVLRDQYKKYTRENREQMRGNMEKMRDQIRKNREDMQRQLKEGREKLDKELRKPGDEMKDEMERAGDDMRGKLDEDRGDPAGDDLKKEFDRAPETRDEMGMERPERPEIKQRLERRREKRKGPRRP